MKKTVGAVGAGLLAMAGLVATSVGASAQATMLPMGFTGSLACGEVVQEGQTLDGEPGAYRPPQVIRGMASTSTMTASDPRLAGRVSVVTNTDMYDSISIDGRIFVTNTSLRIENDGGAWLGSYYGFFDTGAIDETAPEPAPVTDIFVLSGQGGYEGLTGVMQIMGKAPNICGFDFRGVIIGGELPPLPEAEAAG